MQAFELQHSNALLGSPYQRLLHRRLRWPEAAEPARNQCGHSKQLKPMIAWTIRRVQGIGPEWRLWVDLTRSLADSAGGYRSCGQSLRRRGMTGIGAIRPFAHGNNKRQTAKHALGRFQPPDFRLELKAQLRGLLVRQPVRHLRKDGAPIERAARVPRKALRRAGLSEHAQPTLTTRISGGSAFEIRICRIAKSSSENELVVGAIDCPRSKASIEFTSLASHSLPAAMIACQKSTPRNATTTIRRIRPRVSRP